MKHILDSLLYLLWFYATVVLTVKYPFITKTEPLNVVAERYVLSAPLFSSVGH